MNSIFLPAKPAYSFLSHFCGYLIFLGLLFLPQGCSSLSKIPLAEERAPLPLRGSTKKGIFLFQTDRRENGLTYSDFRIVIDKKIYRMLDTSTLRKFVDLCPKEKSKRQVSQYIKDRKNLEETLARLTSDMEVELAGPTDEVLLTQVKCEEPRNALERFLNQAN